MLLNNYTINNRNPSFDKGGFTNLYACYKLGTFQNFYCGESSIVDLTDKSSFYNGTYPPYSLVIAPKGGGLSATTLVTGLNAFTTANLAGGLLADATLIQTSTLASDIIGRGVILATLQQANTIVAGIAGQLNAVANLSQTSALTADLGAIISIQAQLDQLSTLVGTVQGALAANANLSQSSVLTASISGQLNALATLAQSSTVAADIIGGWFMQANIAQTSTLTTSIQAIGGLVSSIIGTNNLVGSFSGSIGNMSATFTNSSTLSPENLAAAVWNALAAEFNSNGTMGEIMNNVGAGADPWSTTLPATYSGTQAGNILSQIQTLVDELHKIQGLSLGTPMTVTQTSRTAGSIDLDISGDGETTTTVQRQ